MTKRNTTPDRSLPVALGNCKPLGLGCLENLFWDSSHVTNWRQPRGQKNSLDITCLQLLLNYIATGICDLGRPCSASSNAHATHSSEGFGCLFVEEGSGCCCGHPWGQCVNARPPITAYQQIPTTVWQWNMAMDFPC